MLGFYHKADLDGRCSGAILKKWRPQIKLVGIDYGEPFPWEMLEELKDGSLAGDRLIMVDFSLQPFSEMERLAESCKLVWIDHHKSAIADAKASERFNRACFMQYLDNEKAACEITWEVMLPHIPMPEIVYKLGRYDVWKHKETPGSLELQYGMRLKSNTDADSNLWPFWFDGGGIAQTILDGALCLRYETQQNAAFCSAYAFETELDGLKCIAANRGMSNSLLFENVYDPAKHHAMLMFAWKNGQWTVSLYSTREDVDVSVIAKSRGGGGHKGAAGFQTKTLDFLDQ